MAISRRNTGGPIDFVVDAQADLATIVGPRVGQFALALSEGTLHYHTGTTWVAVTAASTGAPADADYLVGTANGSLSAEIAVGTTPGGELGNTWASPTVDASHSGSTHAATQAAAESTASGALTTHAGAADPHTGYRLESADHTHATTGLQAGTVAHSALTGLTSGDDHTQYRLETDDHTHATTGAQAGTVSHAVLTSLTTGDPHTQYVQEATAQAFSVGGLLVGAPPTNGVYMVWRAPVACTVTNVRAHITAGTNAVINAQVNQTSDFLSSDLTDSTTNAWVDGGTVQNTSISAGDDIGIELVSTSGAVVKVNIQVDLTRTLA
jgi:hypothetical protein